MTVDEILDVAINGEICIWDYGGKIKMKFKDETQDPLRSLDTLYRKKGLI